MLNGIDVNDSVGDKPLHPISLALLDINMPILNGFETLKQIKEMFKRHNTRLNDLMPQVQGDSHETIGEKPEQTLLLRPMIIFFSQYE